ncbi:FadR family transcriptional regulator|uniref:GntR family transcriptional regulator, transcriptional repressor for pyruvate dehydrogenase complex n=1 Tax=Dendrosporobacter quercicolus TaxID=146817 RepID=A0A1G9N548_9FIRM|nr:FadR/GntR family transcriptional regulator [Dendrosporobacter quercicolus]NSL47231.1 FadR family transcriptional regulator [Dendrosporobacter quercicolus DSM 1736]SDL81513.1 GntR family transcriptional regulator, transcriptional repressor for pyruvate dehydrogenase complex [Dendrosporobacter quercicolus]
MFRPVRTKKVYEEIVHQIKLAIEEGRLKSGDKLLSERDLAGQFKVSRASVREALSALEMMGIIAIQPGEGSYVRHLPSESMLEILATSVRTEAVDILHLLEMRKIIEVETAALAAMRATPGELEELRQSLQQMQAEVAGGGHAEDIDAKFHYILVRAAHNPVLLKVAQTISQLLTSNYRSLRLTLFLIPRMSELFYQAHCEIFEAVAAKDPRLARDKMREHLDTIQEAMRWYKHGGAEVLRIFPSIYHSRYNTSI